MGAACTRWRRGAAPRHRGSPALRALQAAPGCMAMVWTAGRCWGAREAISTAPSAAWGHCKMEAALPPGNRTLHRPA